MGLLRGRVYIGRVSSTHDGRSGKLRYGDVVGVAVRAVGAEGDDDVGSHSTQVNYYLADRFLHGSLIEVTVSVVQQGYAPEAQHAGSVMQFGLAHLAVLGAQIRRYHRGR